MSILNVTDATFEHEVLQSEIPVLGRVSHMA